MHNKLADFEANVSIPPTQEDANKLIKLDRINTQLVLHAEKKCRKIYLGAKPYTPDINILGATINAWQVLIHKKEGRQCSVDNFAQLTLEQCISRQALTFQAYNTYGHQIEEKRYSWIDDLADTIAA